MLSYFFTPAGALGYMSTTGNDGNPGLTGNYGFMDQRAAMKFIHENIAAFGGNPKKVCCKPITNMPTSLEPMIEDVQGTCLSPKIKPILLFDEAGVTAREHVYKTYLVQDRLTNVPFGHCVMLRSIYHACTL